MSLVKNNVRERFPSILSDFFDNDRIFANRWLGEETVTLPSVNIKENKTDFIVELAAPGFKKEDFTVSIAEFVLSIRAEKQSAQEEENERFTRKEFTYNSFERTFTLPPSASSDKIEAQYSNGILELKIPKNEKTQEASRKEIKIS